VHGSVLTPSDLGYRDACALHNAAVGNEPAAIVQVASVADVRATLGLARERDLSVTVRGGGHGLDGAALAGAVVIDVRALRGVVVDPARRTATVRGGATWAELDEATGAHGFVVPGARVGAVGVAGSVLAGCTGWLTARYGASERSVLAAESVTVDGVSTGPMPAPGGAPAVVTSMTFALHPLPSLVLAGCLLYRLADGADAAAALAALAAQRRPEFAPLLRWQLAPAAAFVPGDVVGRPVLTVLPVWVGDPAEGVQFLAPLRRAARPLVDAIRAMPYAELQCLLDGASPWGRRRAEIAVEQPARPDWLAARLEGALTDRPGPHGFVDLAPTASPGTWSLRAEAQWLDPSDDTSHHAWLAALASELRTAHTQPAQEKERNR
jgi:FAD/FMN-containing dehydrogenase